MRFNIAYPAWCAALVIAGCSGSGVERVNATAHPDASAPVGSVAHDRGVFTELLQKHTRIRREFREIDGGIESLTESDDPRVAALIVEHVQAMKKRVETGARIRQWDPLYVAVFDAGERIRLEIERTGKGVRVRETSSDPEVVKLIRQHAGVVSGFVSLGSEESAKEHPVER
ncbi:MAG TPA: hypothetical protein VEB22_06595 [Phycisphaerales bacterium]|nr:hypothetical protein [Phycisphaerales bacterium]